MSHLSAKYETSLHVGDDVLGEALRLRRRGISVIPIGGEKKPALGTWKQFQSAVHEMLKSLDLDTEGGDA